MPRAGFACRRSQPRGQERMRCSSAQAKERSLAAMVHGSSQRIHGSVQQERVLCHMGRLSSYNIVGHMTAPSTNETSLAPVSLHRTKPAQADSSPGRKFDPRNGVWLHLLGTDTTKGDLAEGASARRRQAVVVLSLWWCPACRWLHRIKMRHGPCELGVVAFECPALCCLWHIVSARDSALQLAPIPRNLPGAGKPHRASLLLHLNPRGKTPCC